MNNEALKVCIDAGHYGSKYNNSPVKRDYYESNMTWRLTNLLKSELEKKGVHVVLSRTTKDQNPALTTRGEASRGCDLFISIHSNACDTESVDYPIVYRGFDKVEAEELALRLSKLIQNLMGTKQAGRTATRKSTKSNTEYYGVLRGARNAGLTYYYIIEHSFHTNLKATEWLSIDSNLQALAVAEADCIVNYFNEKGIGTKDVQTVPVTKPVQTVPVTNNTNNTITTNNVQTVPVPFRVKILANELNIRTGAGTNYKIVGSIKDHGVYTIIETNSTGTWGKLKSGAGWISLNAKYAKRV